jgi:hypothetical protein
MLAIRQALIPRTIIALSYLLQAFSLGGFTSRSLLVTCNYSEAQRIHRARKTQFKSKAAAASALLTFKQGINHKH